MVLASLISFAGRGLQLVFAAVVLGLSIHLIRGQGIDGTTPATTSYNAFVGGFGMLAALVGIVAAFVDSLNGLIMMGLDALTAVFFLAGGIVRIPYIIHPLDWSGLLMLLFRLLRSACAAPPAPT